VDCQGRKEEGGQKKCYKVGYWRQATITWIIHNSRSGQLMMSMENVNLPVGQNTTAAG